MRFHKSGKSLCNLKFCGLAFIGGCAASYNESVLELYSLYTSMKHSSVSPVRLEYESKQIPIYEKSSRNGLTQLRSWENLDRNVARDLRVPDKANDDGRRSELPSLTNTTLAKAGGIAVEPTLFHDNKKGSTITIVHVGDQLCGYPFLVHGGMIATILNESFKRNASLISDSNPLKDDFMVTSLSISYKAPSLANQFLVVNTRCVGQDHKSIISESSIETVDGKVLVVGKANLVETGRASSMNVQSKSRTWTLL